MTTTATHNADIDDVNIEQFIPLITPAELKAELPLSNEAYKTVLKGRHTIQDILDGKDKRLFIVIGPCSIHDIKAAHEYADRLAVLAKEVEDTIFVVMRVYFEKPRTTVGWKGMINDPDMNDSFDIEKGLRTARKLLLDLNEKGLPCATEALDPNTPQYMQDLISWSAIGARTTESQTHREMSSGLSCPVGFKNGTDGGMTVAVNAMQAVKEGHSFLGLSADGQVSIIKSKGNAYAHVVLRGGNGKPNYDETAVAQAENELAKGKTNSKIMIDSSHANSGKDPYLQPMVIQNVAEQIQKGNKSIIGMMIESHLKGGNQKLTEDLSQLEYGKSITDGCLDWDSTVTAIHNLRDTVKDILPNR
ncbi:MULTISPECIES: 3-deoxy-7-phosphoheptulonate synthase [unclassified Psychrobacter]|uniref:3-deoxy-7-phosphoheptulonate synthase n=1 Tax=unclassified Psychrobacter TaxID=196806 RepID=UPI00071E9ACB|nr:MULTISPECIES: 3-deoxy-7-phosphoheptulonate synthase [unclassified Psychrobacter]OLF38264.1 3-deoxy-7-phosphoheptulonate synthase [Psychrobacter sp. Cmf 22.2]